jgi:hypothetical protein
MNDSKRLLTFINKHLSLCPPVKLSPLSKILLGKIAYQMELGETSWKTNETYRHEILTEFPKGEHYDGLVGEVRTEIETMQKIGKKYSFSIGDREFSIYILYPFDSRKSAKAIYATLDAYVTKIYIWLFVANHFSENHCSRSVSIYIFLTKMKKVLPSTPEPIDSIHANTAFTTACALHRDNIIYIYRREEWFKVLIHETFHTLGMDFSTMDETPAKRAMYDIFPVNCDLRFYECYTETWAEIIHILFLAQYSKPTNPKKDKTLELFLQQERLFSIFQTIKVLRHYQLSYKELCTDPKDKYDENTNVFSYFILKSIMIFFSNDFIEWCSLQNKGTIVFKKIQANVLSLVQFVKDRYTDTGYIKTLQHMEKAMKSLESDAPEMQTLRMTVHESSIFPK